MRAIYPESVLNFARDFARSSLGYQWTRNEELALRAFFTNTNGRVAFMFGLPANVGATLLAMYSRMHNNRGLRGVFVDSFLPGFLASRMVQVAGAPEEDSAGKKIDQASRFLSENKIGSLDAFINYSDETEALYFQFMNSATTKPEYMEEFANAKKAKVFLGTWLDKYGHNSIARMASVWLIIEQCSTMLAKSLEWSRPSFGAVELSTRFVKRSRAGVYPLAELLELGYGISRFDIEKGVLAGFDQYTKLAGQDNDGPFPEFLRKHYGKYFDGNNADLEAGVFGETCDVLGNFLPACTLTSLGVNISGEALPGLIKHLYLDNTPESIATAELIVEESGKIGANQFIRHETPNQWDIDHWQYLSTRHFHNVAVGLSPESFNPMNAIVTIQELFRLREEDNRGSLGYRRGNFDKLPNEFEAATVSFVGKMSFRGWRDVQRHGFSTHARTRLSTQLGFYLYDKPQPSSLDISRDEIRTSNRALAVLAENHGVPTELVECLLVLGWNVGFTFIANLRQWEFCVWQRSKPDVNHEVRQVFLSGELGLRRAFGTRSPWWSEHSRANMTSSYVFARGRTPIELTREMY